MKSLTQQLKDNWKSGVSVALVSVPLSFSLAIASGASPMTGIITAVWAGLIGGLIGGSKFNIIGPAGALAGILAGYAIMFGPAILPFLAIVAGLIILVVWLLGWDKYLIFVPSSVIHGFTLGVACTIAFGQLNAAFGLTGLPTHESAISNLFESFRHLGSINFGTFLSFAIGLALMFTLLKYRPLWPNSIIVAILGVLLGYAVMHQWIPIEIQTVGTKYPNLSRNLFLFPSWANFSSNASFAALSTVQKLSTILNFSTVIAFVVILETLISAKIADGMTKTKFNQRREVLGVGLANIASGIFGGLPASGVFARTALNVKTGAKSNYSQMINAVAVALLAVVFLSGLNYLPLSITASILVYAAIRMVGVHHFKKLYKFDKLAFGLSLVVAALTLIYDATTGILVGTLVALLVFARKLSTTQLGSQEDPDNFNPEDIRTNAIVYRFAGTMTYITSQTHLQRIQYIPSDKPVVLNFRHLYYIDVDGFEALDEIVELLEQRHQKIVITGVRPEMLTFFNEHAWFRNLSSEGKICDTTDKAVQMCTT
jgi:SulP family sulfate permease